MDNYGCEKIETCRVWNFGNEGDKIKCRKKLSWRIMVTMEDYWLCKFQVGE